MSAIAEAKRGNIHSKIWEMSSAHIADRPPVIPVFD